MTKNKINRAIKHLRLEIVSHRGIGRDDSYIYFSNLDTETQVGDCVSVRYLNQMTLGRWVEEAEHQLRQYAARCARIARERESYSHNILLQCGAARMD